MSCVVSATRANGMLSRRPMSTLAWSQSVSTLTRAKLPGGILCYAHRRKPLRLLRSDYMASCFESQSSRHYTSDPEYLDSTIDVPQETAILRRMARSLCIRVSGQDHIAEAVTKVILTSRAITEARNRPLASFLFLGPDGVGKTEFCRALAAEMGYKDERSDLLILKMSGSQHIYHTRAWVASGNIVHPTNDPIWDLTQAVRRRPNTVILIDGLEKAHEDVVATLREILNKGEITASDGHKVDFRKTVVVLKSKLGSNALNLQAKKRRTTNLHPSDLLKSLDLVLVFKKLSRESILEIIDRRLKSVATRASYTDFQVTLDVDHATRHWIAERVFSDTDGLRDLDRVIQTKVGEPLLSKLRTGAIRCGESARIRVSGDSPTVLNNQAPYPLFSLDESEPEQIGMGPPSPTTPFVHQRKKPRSRRARPQQRVVVKWPGRHIRFHTELIPDMIDKLNLLFSGLKPPYLFKPKVDKFVAHAEITETGHLALCTHPFHLAPQLQLRLEENLEKSAVELLRCFPAIDVDLDALKWTIAPVFELDNPNIGIVIYGVPAYPFMDALDSGHITEEVCRATGLRTQDIRSIRVMCKYEEMQKRNYLTLAVMLDHPQDLKTLRPLIKNGVLFLDSQCSVGPYRQKESPQTNPSVLGLAAFLPTNVLNNQVTSKVPSGVPQVSRSAVY